MEALGMKTAIMLEMPAVKAFQEALDRSLGPALQRAGMPQVEPRVLEVSHLIEKSTVAYGDTL